MPILIKSSSGQRSVQLVSNNTQREPDLRSELIDILRGLTLKLELRVNDVVVGGLEAPISLDDLTGATNVAASAGQPKAEIDETTVPPVVKRQEEPKETKQINGPSATAPDSFISRNGLDPASLSSLGVKRAPSCLEADKIEPSETAGASRVPSQGDERPPQPQAEAKEPVVTSPPLVAEKAQPVKASLKPLNRLESLTPKKPVLVRGELKVGTIINTLCVNVLSQKEEITTYVTYDQKKLVEIMLKIKEIEEEIEAQPLVKSVEIGDIVFGKSSDDDGWYRGMVMSVRGDDVELYFFDWGCTETVEMTRVRRLTELGLGLAKKPACAVKVKFTEASKNFLAQVFDCAKRFRMRVESYDEADDGFYTATILGLLED